jgi:hypothetical protein
MAIDVRSDDPCTATLISLQLRQAPVTEQSSQLQRTKRDNESTNQIVSCSISSTMPQSKRPIASLPIRAIANDANKTAQHPINQERTIAEPAQLIIGKREREQFLHDHHPERDAEESASKRHHDDDEW